MIDQKLTIEELNKEFGLMIDNLNIISLSLDNKEKALSIVSRVKKIYGTVIDSLGSNIERFSNKEMIIEYCLVKAKTLYEKALAKLDVLYIEDVSVKAIKRLSTLFQIGKEE